MPNIVDLIGDTVVRANGDKIRTEKLAADGQIVGLYFSAQWCPPCRGFTPKLIEFYKSFKDKKLEVVFISSDRDDKQFTEYFQEMPWFALPFEDRDRKVSGEVDLSGTDQNSGPTPPGPGPTAGSLW